jgi:two-component system chemotaxis sensor kinase CheA
VIKPLGSYLGSVAGVAGATISGDGSVRLILDPAGLAGIFSGMLS